MIIIMMMIMPVLRGMGILGLVGFLLILVFQLRVPWTLLDGVIMA